MSHRFFVSSNSIKGNKVTFTDDISYQIRKVLRLRVEDEVIVLDGKGGEYRVQLTAVSKSQVIGILLETKQREKKPAIDIIIGQGFPKGNKMDLIVRKGTELGVSSFVPLLMERSIVKTNQKEQSKKMDRLRRIAKEAAEQSGRRFVPSIDAPRPLKEFCDIEDETAIKIIFWEKETQRGLKEIFSLLATPPKRIAMLIGPEGGISDEEIEIARDKGFLTVSLGELTLRTETVVLAATSIIQYHYGGIGIGCQGSGVGD